MNEVLMLMEENDPEIYYELIKIEEEINNEDKGQ